MVYFCALKYFLAIRISTFNREKVKSSIFKIHFIVTFNTKENCPNVELLDTKFWKNLPVFWYHTMLHDDFQLRLLQRCLLQIVLLFLSHFRLWDRKRTVISNTGKYYFSAPVVLIIFFTLSSQTISLKSLPTHIFQI